MLQLRSVQHSDSIEAEIGFKQPDTSWKALNPEVNLGSASVPSPIQASTTVQLC